MLTLDKMLAAKATVLAIDPATPSHSTADALIAIARGNAHALKRALHRLSLEESDLARRAGDLLRHALDRLDGD